MPKAPHKYFEDQFDDEEVLYVFRKHPVVMRKGLIFGSLGLLLGPLSVIVLSIVRPDDPPTMTFFMLSLLAGLALGAVIFFPFWLGWFYSVFIVSDQRFIQITQKGFFHRSVYDMSLDQIQMVNYQVSGLQETMLGFGTIMLQTFVGDMVIHDIHKPAHTQKKLLSILRAQGVSAAAMPQNSGADDE